MTLSKVSFNRPVKTRVALPAGITYEVEEAAEDGYIAGIKELNGVIISDQTAADTPSGQG